MCILKHQTITKYCDGVHGNSKYPQDSIRLVYSLVPISIFLQIYPSFFSHFSIFFFCFLGHFISFGVMGVVPEPIPPAWSEGRVHVWMSRQLIAGPYVSIWGLVTCSRVLWPPPTSMFWPHWGFNQQLSASESSPQQSELPPSIALKQWATISPWAFLVCDWPYDTSIYGSILKKRQKSGASLCAFLLW